MKGISIALIVIGFIDLTLVNIAIIWFRDSSTADERNITRFMAYVVIALGCILFQLIKMRETK